MLRRTAAAAAALVIVLAAFPHARARADAPAGRYVVTATTAFDTKTMLTWQRALVKSADGGTIATLQDAWAACAAPWRLPEIKELSTLVDETIVAPPLVDPVAFPGTPAVPLWSNTLSNTVPEDFRVFVLRPDGTTTTVYLNGTLFTGGYVRCVQP